MAVIDPTLPPPSSNSEQLERALFEVKKVIVGQDRVHRAALRRPARSRPRAAGRCSRAGQDPRRRDPGPVFGGNFSRIQFTPDLLPSDLVGTRIYRRRAEQFNIELGPVFANFVLADEINRAPAKVQSALLEVMAERQVSIARETHPVPEPFLVLATQNPIESEGVYPLPEAQRDRFLMKLVVGYPTPTEEARSCAAWASARRGGPDASASSSSALQAAADEVYVDPQRRRLRRSARHRHPRAGHSRVARTHRADQLGRKPPRQPGPRRRRTGPGPAPRRSYVLPQDIFDVAPDVLRHRLVLSYEALAQGLSVEQLLARLLSTIPAPAVAPSQDPTASRLL